MAERTYRLLVPWGLLQAGDKITPTNGIGDILVQRGKAELLEERGGKGDTNKAFQKPPKAKR